MQFQDKPKSGHKQRLAGIEQTGGSDPQPVSPKTHHPSLTLQSFSFVTHSLLLIVHCFAIFWRTHHFPDITTLKPILHILSVLLLAVLIIPGCLTVEGKEYRFTLKPDRSGEATIRFINIMSESDDTTDVSADDFRQLIEFYVKGTQLERENPGFKNVQKRLFEENGMLMGEISFTFDSLSAVRLFRFDQSGPYMYFAGSPLSSEVLVVTNGTRGPDWMPVVFWPADASEIYIRTRVVSEVPFHRSLVNSFRQWRDPQDKQ